MEYLLDLFEPEQDPLDPFASYLAANNLYICKKVTVTFPFQNNEDARLAAIKKMLTQYLLRKYSLGEPELRAQIEGDKDHYQGTAIEIWEEYTSSVPQVATHFSLEVGDRVFLIRFYRAELDGLPYWDFEDIELRKLEEPAAPAETTYPARDFETEYRELCNLVVHFLSAKTERKANWYRKKLEDEIHKTANSIL